MQEYIVAGFALLDCGSDAFRTGCQANALILHYHNQLKLSVVRPGSPPWVVKQRSSMLLCREGKEARDSALRVDAVDTGSLLASRPPYCLANVRFILLTVRCLGKPYTGFFNKWHAHARQYRMLHCSTRGTPQCLTVGLLKCWAIFHGVVPVFNNGHGPLLLDLASYSRTKQYQIFSLHFTTLNNIVRAKASQYNKSAATVFAMQHLHLLLHDSH